MDDLLSFIVKISKAKAATNNDSWYETDMLSNLLSKEDIAWNSGLNIKTISNIYQTATREIVTKVSHEHFKVLQAIFDKILTSSSPQMELKIKHDDISVVLNSKEIFTVINALSVRRAAIRGGAWSSAGKQVEKPLMHTLCKLLKVPSDYYDQNKAPESVREIDFFLFGKIIPFKCEVKLMGLGNPESADVVDYRDTTVLVADKLSDTNKTQLTEKNIHWVAMHDGDILTQFSNILTKLEIPHTKFTGDFNQELEIILKELLD